LNKRISIIALILFFLASTAAAEASGFMALYQAILNNDLAAVRSMTPRPGRIDSVDRSTGATPLTWASMKGISPSIADWLISRGADIDGLDGEGNTPLITAAYYGNVGVAKLLLARGADPNRTDKDGRHPLVVAAGHRGHIGIVQALVEAGVDVQGPIGTEAMERAAGCGKEEIANFLRSAGARPSYLRAVKRLYGQ
jgi:ankyrin repeat protein